MSLDVYLERPGEPSETRSVIFVREDGGTRELNRAEWDEKFPGIEPVTVETTEEVFWRNVTHNLTNMADAAGIYKHLWRPEELGIEKAGSLVEPLAEGLKRLQADPATFKVHNPPNGWGSYEGLVAFVSDYLAACKADPEAEIRVSR